MSVIITKEPTGNILNAYNNSILEFTITVGSPVRQPARAIVSVNGFNFNLTPVGGKFFFNAKKIITVLVNQDNFTDNTEVLSPLSYLFTDSLLYKEVNVLITVYTTTGTSFATNRNYKYLKSVQQIVRSKYIEREDIRILSPSIDANKSVTYFEGLPFDVSIYSSQDMTATLLHARTQNTLTVNLKKGVNRLFISNGENDNRGFEGVFPLFLGVNKIEIIPNNESESQFLFINKKSVKKGVYLKFFNQNGGWSYWRFEQVYRAGLQTKSLTELNNDNNNLEQATNRVSQTGKDAMLRYFLNTGVFNMQERLVLSQLFSSPKVYLYNNMALQPFSISDFIEVSIPDSTKELYNTKYCSNAYDVEIELPQLYTQSYGG